MLGRGNRGRARAAEHYHELSEFFAADSAAFTSAAPLMIAVPC